MLNIFLKNVYLKALDFAFWVKRFKRVSAMRILLFSLYECLFILVDHFF